MPSFATFRQPDTKFAPSSSSLPPLKPQDLLKTWWVTTSTLPMWKSAKNITITYTPVPSSNYIDDIIHYNPRDSPPASEEGAKPTVKSIHGVDYPLSETPTDLSYKWRGKGWLFIATSRWQVVGYGGRDVKEVDGVLEGVEWVLTFFEKSLFTPAGVDIMTVAKEGVDEETRKAIDEGLKGCGGTLEGLQPQMFEIPRD
ncbi:hypothetical protein H072_4593 [Dactylellina haptotyla CBS 200.50]|uniref:Uncharacterized protein n=1 Tax=Dactylellina haptotyla (strain CBS 200.50) TaxID=1284197 RepID=S8AF14_DACHA|nr:hypothetical protein H072_4593 [Dactylellina haptotyla CBS 200.50]